MAQLNPNNLPFSPASKAVEVIRATLDTATVANNARLNASVFLGAEKVQKDALAPKLESSTPYIAIAYETGEFLLGTSKGASVRSLVSVHFYFVYNTGVSSTSPVASTFLDSRERHIRWNLEWLKDKAVLPYTSIGIPDSAHLDDAGKRYWYWPEGPQSIHLEYESPLKLLGIDLPMTGQFNCVRADFQIMTLNHATFTGDPAGGIT